jgi:hypothetical protein
MGTDLVSWQEELAREAKEVASIERPAITQISLRAGVMQYRGVPIPGNKLKCVILSSAIERRYDTKPFDPANIAPPDCFALSTSGIDMGPDPNSSDPQSAKCEGCPMNAWQPNPRRPGKNHKPCKERRRIVVVPADTVESGTVRGAEMAMLAIPVTSVKHWAAYVNRIATEYNRPPWGMVTEIVVTPNAQTQFEVKFEPVSPIEEDYLPGVYARVAGAKDAVLVPYDASGYMAPEDAPEEKKPKKPSKF